ncbi:Rieske (2Fe-2S) protein [Hwanghaeella grinnelliae]|uniref:Rieske (2Fe-2S) protein n=1 Tax=Hwanghaeella grinnelliae TaxID=2500179 RepID=A0A3S2Y1L6_9PROT|nr:Rieske (2Fe-2S) protein [Hwanghaeella grinnelliae]RVU35117.1 Rieske (2Fe-2S) protein [Hwanghaeella grinnelliae]
MSSPEDLQWIAVVPSVELLPDKPHEVLIGENIFVLIRHGETIGAYQGQCPHQFARLVEGRVADGHINCPRHMAKFRLSDGICGPGWALPPLRRYTVKEDGGMVHICLQAIVDD